MTILFSCVCWNIFLLLQLPLNVRNWLFFASVLTWETASICHKICFKVSCLFMPPRYPIYSLCFGTCNLAACMAEMGGCRGPLLPYFHHWRQWWTLCASSFCAVMNSRDGLCEMLMGHWGLMATVSDACYLGDRQMKTHTKKREHFHFVYQIHANWGFEKM